VELEADLNVLVLLELQIKDSPEVRRVLKPMLTVEVAVEVQVLSVRMEAQHSEVMVDQEFLLL
jgi:hypothetical protein